MLAAALTVFMTTAEAIGQAGGTAPTQEQWHRERLGRVLLGAGDRAGDRRPHLALPPNSPGPARP